MPLRRRDEELLKAVKTRNEEPQIMLLCIWFFALCFCLLAGSVLGYFGIGQLRIHWFASREPQDVLLYELENDFPPPGNHVRIGNHISMATVWVNDTYPIFSIEETAIEDYVDTSPNEPFETQTMQLMYRMRKCRILVRNRQERKSDIYFEGPIEGLIVGRASDLDFGESSFERLNIREPEKVFVLETGRKPNAWPGIFLTVFSLAFFIGAFVILKPLSKTLKQFSFD